MRLTRGNRVLGALVTACLLAGLAPASTLATATTPPYLDVRDAPFVRNSTVNLRFQGPLINPPAVAEYFAANSKVLNDQGHLAGTSVAWSSQWTLTAGDGDKTIYGQIHYQDNTWSAILELHLTLATGAGSAMAVDIDPQDTAPSLVLHLSGGHQWQEVLRTPSEPFYASAATDKSFVIFNSFWDFYFSTAAAPFAPGTYEIGPFDSNGDCVGNCADVVTETSTSCHGTHSGWFKINSISIAGSDLQSADVDFRIVCRNYLVMAGTLLYGVERDLTAIDQGTYSMTFAPTNVGATTGWQTLTLTNIGDANIELGNAAISASAISDSRPGDFEMDTATDTCSSAVLEADEDCSVKIRYNPTAPGTASAVLSLTDNTLRGLREVALRGQGQQQVTVNVGVTGSLAAPGPVNIVATVSPAAGNCFLQLWVDGIPDFHPDPSQWTYQSQPSQYVTTWTTSLPPGNYTAHATTGNCLGYLGSSDSEPFTITGEATPPTGTMVINGGSGITNDGQVHLDLTASDPSGISKVAIGATENIVPDPESVTWQLFDPTSYLSFGVSPDPVHPDNTVYTVYVRWRDGAANWSDPVMQQITVDTIAPDVEPPAQEFVAGSQIAGGNVPVVVPWSGTDNLTGVDSYNLNGKTDTGTWKDIAIGSGSRLNVSGPPDSVDLLLAPAHKYAFRVKATDAATNTSAWATGASLTLKKTQDGSSKVSYIGSAWKKATATAFWGGTVRKATRAGARLLFSFTGRSIGWVTTMGPDRGKAEVYVNNVLVAAVDLYSPTFVSQTIAWAGNWTTSAARTITIKVLGTAGRSRVDLDAFVTSQ